MVKQKGKIENKNVFNSSLMEKVASPDWLGFTELFLNVHVDAFGFRQDFCGIISLLGLYQSSYQVHALLSNVM